jgi:hypothetical protein
MVEPDVVDFFFVVSICGVESLRLDRTSKRLVVLTIEEGIPF